jgi:2-oxoglutarate dehydrogenase E2 component (dihydrolipoamide succinyltransferase)
MAIEVKVPTGGESITEVVVAEWLKQPGDTVRQDEPLVTLETDKAALDLPSPAAGVLARIVKSAGETARVGEVIAYLEETAAAVQAAPAAAPTEPARAKTAAAAAPTPPRAPGRAAPAPAAPPAAERAAARAATPTAARPAAEREPPRVMPAARRVLAEGDVSADEVTPTGPGGRVLKEDALRHLEAAKVAPAAGGREEEAVPMSMLRRRVAERLVRAQQTAALLTTFNEIDMSAVIALRRAHQEAFQERHQVKLGFMSFFVKATIEALRLIPQLNAEIRGTDIVYRNYHDIGIAVGGGRGLVVPVLRDAEQRSFAEVEIAIADFARRAQANQLTVDELQGGTFTISNGGVYGSLLSTPIVNPPQSGVLGLHVIQDRPVARDGQVVVRPMMYVALTYDHRIVDGREAVTFLRHVKACVEEPARMLLEI